MAFSYLRPQETAQPTKITNISSLQYSKESTQIYEGK